MKTLFLICIFPIYAYTQIHVSPSEARLQDLKDKVHLEAQTRLFIENYIRDLNDPDWHTKSVPILETLNS